MRVWVYDLRGKYVEECRSMKDAAEKYNVTEDDVRDAVRCGVPRNGHFFDYAIDPPSAKKPAAKSGGTI